MNHEVINSAETLRKDIYVLRLCLDDCTRGSVLAHNPYLRSPKTKKHIQALKDAVIHVLEDILKFSAQLAKYPDYQQILKNYYEAYAFLFEFNDDIRREEDIHLILIRDAGIQAKFNKLFYYSEVLLSKVKEKEV